MTDKELLEYAAKAEGRTLKYITQIYSDREETFIACWNPLADDGDALRLAVKLDIDVFYQSDEEGRFTSAEGGAFAYEHHGADPYAATRRAIVRAAAEIGRAASPSQQEPK